MDVIISVLEGSDLRSYRTFWPTLVFHGMVTLFTRWDITPFLGSVYLSTTRTQLVPSCCFEMKMPVIYWIGTQSKHSCSRGLLSLATSSDGEITIFITRWRSVLSEQTYGILAMLSEGRESSGWHQRLLFNVSLDVWGHRHPGWLALQCCLMTPNLPITWIIWKGCLSKALCLLGHI